MAENYATQFNPPTAELLGRFNQELIDADIDGPLRYGLVTAAGRQLLESGLVVKPEASNG